MRYRLIAPIQDSQNMIWYQLVSSIEQLNYTKQQVFNIGIKA